MASVTAFNIYDSVATFTTNVSATGRVFAQNKEDSGSERTEAQQSLYCGEWFGNSSGKFFEQINSIFAGATQITGLDINGDLDVTGTFTLNGTAFGAIADGTTTSATLRWDGADWVENTTILHSATGDLTATGDVTVGDFTAGCTTEFRKSDAGTTVLNWRHISDTDAVGHFRLIHRSDEVLEWEYYNGATWEDMLTFSTSGINTLDPVVFDTPGLRTYPQTNGNISNGIASLRWSSVFISGFADITEAASVASPAAGDGRYWVRNDVPNVPMFTSDDGTAHVLAYDTGGGALPAGSSDGQTLRWEDGTSSWDASSVLLIDDAGNITTTSATTALTANNAVLLVGDGAGSPSVSLDKDGVGTSSLLFDVDSAGAADGLFRLHHDASETFGAQSYFSAAWNWVWSVASAGDTVTFAGDVNIGGVTQSAGIADGTADGQTLRWEAATSTWDATSVLLIDDGGNATFSGFVTVDGTNLHVDNGAAVLLLGDSTGTPQTQFRKSAAGSSLQYFFSGDAVASDGDFRHIHDGAETFALQSFFSAAWNNVFSVASGQNDITFAGDVIIGGVTQSAGIADGSADGQTLRWEAATSTFDVTSALLVSDAGVVSMSSDVDLTAGGAVLSVGSSGLGSPVVRVMSAEASLGDYRWLSNGQLDWIARSTATDHDYHLIRLINGVEQDHPIEIDNGTGAIDFADGAWRFDPTSTDLTSVAGSKLVIGRGVGSSEFTSTSVFEAFGGGGGGMLVANNDTNNTNKLGRWGIPSYVNIEEPFYGIFLTTGLTQNTLDLGGGTGLGNAATRVGVWLGAINTTSGTEEWRWTPGELTSIAGTRFNVGVGLENFIETNTIAEFQGQSGVVLITNSNTDLANKQAILAMPQYDTPAVWHFLRADSQDENNTLYVGGDGAGADSDADNIEFYIGTTRLLHLSTSNALLPGVDDTTGIGLTGNRFSNIFSSGFLDMDQATDLGTPAANTGRFGVLDTATTTPGFADDGGTTHTLAYLDAGNVTLPAGTQTGAPLTYGGASWGEETEARFIDGSSTKLLWMADNLTDVTAKQAGYGVGHYTNAEEPFIGLAFRSDLNVAAVHVGGLDSIGGNVADVIHFNTGTGYISTTENRRGTVDSSGSWGFFGQGSVGPLATESGDTVQFRDANSALEVLGSNGLITISDSITNLSAKTAQIVCLHETNSEESFLGIYLRSDGTDNEVRYGGSSGSFNAATQHRWYIGATDTTTTGAESWRIEVDHDLIPLQAQDIGESTNGITHLYFEETGTEPTVAAGDGALYTTNGTPSAASFKDDAGNVHHLSLCEIACITPQNAAQDPADTYLRGATTATATARAVFGSAGERAALQFGTTGTTELTFEGCLPGHYAGGGITAQVEWHPTNTNTNTAVFETAFEAFTSGLSASGGNSFGTGVSNTVTPGGTANVIQRDTHSHTNSEIDGMTAGDCFRFVFRRLGGDASDTFTGTAYIHRIRLYETSTLADA